MPEISAPANPAANDARIYVKDDGSGNTKLYYRDSAGTEYELGGGGPSVLWQPIRLHGPGDDGANWSAAGDAAEGTAAVARFTNHTIAQGAVIFQAADNETHFWRFVVPKNLDTALGNAFAILAGVSGGTSANVVTLQVSLGEGTTLGSPTYGSAQSISVAESTGAMHFEYNNIPTTNITAGKQAWCRIERDGATDSGLNDFYYFSGVLYLPVDPNEDPLGL